MECKLVYISELKNIIKYILQFGIKGILRVIGTLSIPFSILKRY
ncbi:protein of unknown function [Clostridium beijerinckii]|nr:protein of unknown function [Clostridium beijerinckii]